MVDKSTLKYLAQLLDSNIAPIEASTRLLSICPHDKHVITQLLKSLNLERTLATSIHQAGFTSRLEYEILKVAEQAGKTSQALRFISSNIQKRQKRSRDLRTRLILPNTIIFIILTINAVQAVTARVAISSILITSIIVIAISISITYLLISLARRDASYWLSIGWRLSLQQSSKLFRHYSDHFFFTLFYWQVDAGIDYISGAKTLSTLFDADTYQRSMTNYLHKLKNGETVTNALTDTHLLAPGELQQVISTGENSGRLTQALQHYLSTNQPKIDQSLNTLLTWIPRIYYFITMLMAVVIIF